METQELRNITAAAAERMGGKLWPNGIGFDRRGWEFCFAEGLGRWSARRADSGGYGDSPESALAAARVR